MIKSGKHRSARQSDSSPQKPTWPMKQRSTGDSSKTGTATASHKRGKAAIGGKWASMRTRKGTGSPVESIDTQGDQGGKPVEQIGGY